MNTSPPLYTQDEAQAEQYFLRGVLGKLRRRKWSVLLVAVALFMVLGVGIQALPKTYQGVATVEADVQTTQAVQQFALLRDQTFSDYTLGSELTILASPELLTAAIRRLNLTADPEFNRALAPPDIIGQVRGKISELIAQWLPNNNPVKIDSADRTLSETVYGLLAHVKFEPIPRSRDIQITVSSRNNTKAALIANTLADTYETNHLEFAQRITARAHGFIDGNLDKLKADALAKSQAVARFKNENGLITSDASRATTLLQEQTSQASNDLTRVRADLAASEARWQTALHTDPGSLASVLGSPTIQRYRDQEAILGSQLANLQSTYGDNAPQLQKLKAQYGAVRASIAAESRRQVDSLKNDINSQRATVASLTERLATLKSQINNMTTAQASMIPLQREADAANDLYDTYAKTVRQTDANMLFPAASVRVVSQAMVPVYPSSPNNMVMLPAAFLLSIGVAGMIGFGREASRKGLVSMNEVESVLDIETLGLLPRITKHNEAIYRDAVEQLFNRLWFADPRPHSILITSARPQEGKSTTARALAVAAAERDIRVLLIDADMRTSRLVNKGVSNLGLGDVLRGHVELEHAVRRDHDSKNLMVLPSGEPRGIPTRLLALNSFDTMFSRLKIDYDLIIVDAPPTFVGGDCWLLSQKVDKTVFIAKWGKTTAVDVNEAVRKQLPLANLAGVVLNMVEAKTNMQYGYADSVYLSPQMEQYYKQPKNMIASVFRTRTASAERTYAELPDGTAIRYALKWQVMGFLLLVCHVLLTKQSFLLFPVVLVMLGWIYSKAPLAGLLVYFQFLIYQNWVISLFSPGMIYNPTFVMLQGTNFAAIVLMAAIGLNRVFVPMWQRNPRIHLITVAILIALCFAAAYGMIGAARQGPTSASVYFREFTGSAFAVLVGLDVGRVWGFRTIAHGFLVSVVPSIILAIIENQLPSEYYAWINASDFMNLKSAASPSNPVSYSPADIIDGLTSGFFNISNADPSSWKSYRFMSASMHGISYAYILAVASLISVAVRRSWWLLFTLPLLAIAGVKGAVMLLACCLVLWIIWLLTASRHMVVVNGLILLVAYVAFGIRSGINNLDFHVIGFLGGVHGFVSNPLGRGLGVGGNLSSTAASGFHWEGAGGFMATGADFALESAVGVLIYQMGIGAIAIFAVFMVLLDPKSFGKRVVQRSGAIRNMPLRQDMLFIAVATVMVNGVFQEEAYAPTAAALLALLCAVIIINGQRTAVKLTSHASMLPRRVAAA